MDGIGKRRKNFSSLPACVCEYATQMPVFFSVRFRDFSNVRCFECDYSLKVGEDDGVQRVDKRKSPDSQKCSNRTICARLQRDTTNVHVEHRCMQSKTTLKPSTNERDRDVFISSVSS